jgi:hypothetical protein
VAQVIDARQQCQRVLMLAGVVAARMVLQLDGGERNRLTVLTGGSGSGSGMPSSVTCGRRRPKFSPLIRSTFVSGSSLATRMTSCGLLSQR